MLFFITVFIDFVLYFNFLCINDYNLTFSRFFIPRLPSKITFRPGVKLAVHVFYFIIVEPNF